MWFVVVISAVVIYSVVVNLLINWIDGTTFRSRWTGEVRDVERDL